MKVTNRRDFFKLATAAATTAAIPTTSLAYLGNAPDAQTKPNLPDWWERLTGPGAETDEGVFAPWEDTEVNRELAQKLEDLRLFLVESGAAFGLETVTDFGLHWQGDGSPHSVVVVGRSGQSSENLHRYRPEFGWINRATAHSAA